MTILKIKDSKALFIYRNYIYKTKTSMVLNRAARVVLNSPDDNQYRSTLKILESASHIDYLLKYKVFLIEKQETL